MSDIIKTKDLCLWYGSTQALKNMNITIKQNSITALIGPSGCGKSTFLKTLNRMNDLNPIVKITGDVEYRNHSIFDSSVDVSELRRHIGMVFQKPNPFPMNIYDNVAYGPRTHGIKSKAKLDEIVEQSLRQAAIWDEVKDRLKKSALGISGGQQQRLCIARALAVEPDVLLMDEPTSALDPISTSKVEDLVIELKKSYTIIIVTHNMQQAVRISRNVPVIMATAKGMEYDKVQSLDLGADDYMVKPFGMMEMVSRVKAVLRRSETKDNKGVLEAGGLVINTNQHTVFAGGERVVLTFKEYELLRLFLSHPKMVYTRDQLFSEIWGMDYCGETRTVDMHIRTLRQKLGSYGDMIETVRNVGYRLEARK